jgi:hypothetical protein
MRMLIVLVVSVPPFFVGRPRQSIAYSERREHQEGKGRASLGEPTEQFGMSGSEFLDRRLEKGFGRPPVSLPQESDEFFHRGSLRRGKFRNELTKVSRTHVSPQIEKVYSGDEPPTTGMKSVVVDRVLCFQ